MKHSTTRVISTVSSIQGQWVNDDRWNNFPKHILETNIEMPMSVINPKPLKEIKNNVLVSDYYTRYMRKKYQMVNNPLL